MHGTIQVHHYFPGGLLFTYYMDLKLCTTFTVVNVCHLIGIGLQFQNYCM